MFNKSLVIILVFAFAFVCIIQTPAQSQGGMGCTNYKRLFVNNQWGLPDSSSIYTPCGSYYDWHIEFMGFANTNDWAGVYFTIVGADLNELYTTDDITETRMYYYNGSGFTGSGTDYLRIKEHPNTVEKSFMGLMELELKRTYNNPSQ